MLRRRDGEVVCGFIERGKCRWRTDQSELGQHCLEVFYPDWSKPLSPNLTLIWTLLLARGYLCGQQ